MGKNSPGEKKNSTLSISINLLLLPSLFSSLALTLDALHDDLGWGISCLECLCDASVDGANILRRFA